MARDRVAQPVAEPPGGPAAGQRDAERHHRDQRSADVDAGAVRHQPGQRAHLQPVAGRAVGAGVGQEPAGHAEGQADDQRAGRGDRAGQRRQQHQGPPVPQVDVELTRGRRGSSSASARSFAPSSPRVGVRRRCHAESGHSGPGRYRGAAMSSRQFRSGRSRSASRSPEGFEAFYKDVRGRLLLQTYALTGDLHRLGARGARRPGGRLAPLAQGLAARRSPRTTSARWPGPAPSAAARRAGGPGRRTSPPTSARRSTPWASCPPPSARCCC